MKRYRAYFIDLDGTIYKGKERILSAENWVHQLQQREIPFLFVTNNATKTPQEVAERLKEHYGIDVEASTIVTSGLATVAYLQTHFATKELYVIGENTLKQQLQTAGYRIDSDKPDVVVQSVDRQVTYQQLEKATLAIRNGAHFITTNSDTNIPTERGMVPGSGSISAFLKAATQVDPIVIGKPSSILMQFAFDHLHRMYPFMQPLSKEELVMVGDNYDTDIQAGISYGIDTVMVLTGLSTRQSISGNVQPTYLLDDLAGWFDA